MMRPPRGVLRLHDLDGFLGADEQAGEIGGDHGLPLVERQIFDRHRRRADAGIVEQHVEPAVGLLGLGEQRFDGGRIADVGRHRQALRRASARLLWRRLRACPCAGRRAPPHSLRASTPASPRGRRRCRLRSPMRLSARPSQSPSRCRTSFAESVRIE